MTNVNRDLPKLLLTVEELAVQLTCTRRHVTNLLKDGVLPSVKIGGLRRIRWSDYQAYVDSLPAERGSAA